MLFLAPVRAIAQHENPAEYRVKLAFLYRFAQFVEWPADAFPDAAAPLAICVVGQDPFKGEPEDDLRGRTVGGRSITVKRLKSENEPNSCQIIFVRASEKRLTARMLAALERPGTLVVGETNGFADLGGMINLTVDQNRLRFEINMDAVARTRLSISSKLLALAIIVKAEKSP